MCTFSEAKIYAREYGIPTEGKTRAEFMTEILEHQKARAKSDKRLHEAERRFCTLSIYNKLRIIRQLGKSGKEGVVFLVARKDGKQYALKTFKSSKSSKTLSNEVEFQQRAYTAGVAPRIVDYSLDEKWILMDLCNRTLIDVVTEQGGILTESQQRAIIALFKNLDNAGVVHGDANPLNIMERNGKWFLIDYGFAKDKTHKEYVTYTAPNFQLMPLGLLLWLKNKVPTKNWTYIRKQIAKNAAEKFEIDTWK